MDGGSMGVVLLLMLLLLLLLMLLMLLLDLCKVAKWGEHRTISSLWDGWDLEAISNTVGLLLLRLGLLWL